MIMVVMDGDDDGDVVGADGRGAVVAHAPRSRPRARWRHLSRRLAGPPGPSGRAVQREGGLGGAADPGGFADLGWDGWDVSRYGPGLDRGQDHALGWGGSSLVGSSQAFAALGSSDSASDDGGGGIGEEWRCWQAEVAGVGSAAQRPAFVRG